MTINFSQGIFEGSTVGVCFLVVVILILGLRPVAYGYLGEAGMWWRDVCGAGCGVGRYVVADACDSS